MILKDTDPRALEVLGKLERLRHNELEQERTRLGDLFFRREERAGALESLEGELRRLGEADDPAGEEELDAAAQAAIRVHAHRLQERILDTREEVKILNSELDRVRERVDAARGRHRSILGVLTRLKEQDQRRRMRKEDDDALAAWLIGKVM